MAALPDPAGIRALLLDIEGTTTPVSFVSATLFPYARARIGEFLARHFEEDEVAAALDALAHHRAAEAQDVAGLPPWRDDSQTARLESAAAYLRWLIDHDRKLTPLKSIQGKIWETGYRGGELRGQVYPDVAPAFARWRAQGKTLAIFSSGSALAQKLLFEHSSAGDLTGFLSAYFDTTTGPKQDAESYRRIAAALQFEPRSILFVSDVASELDAGLRAGLPTALCVRGGLQEAQHIAHVVVRNFDEIFP